MVVSIVLLAAACGSSKSKGRYEWHEGRVGEKTFLGAADLEIYGQALAAKGFKVSFKAVGPTEQNLRRTQEGDISLYASIREPAHLLEGTPSGTPLQ